MSWAIAHTDKPNSFNMIDTFDVMWIIPNSLEDIADLPEEASVDELKKICQLKSIKAIIFDAEGICQGSITASGDYQEWAIL
ncbi:hypothetical protein [Aliterella atlantica]|uniref:Uncharacterized protein n=1 Tax=Aliterella atlantica CENA595 TaxID=1618023 RepID=A0A0D8ZLU0_9CYAN|nr:hypothetical protein [Aliterella atlantica]KJH69404.1 hypothetical protein UH38_24180 [Aliterella atlantica CENA595]